MFAHNFEVSIKSDQISSKLVENLFRFIQNTIR